MFHFCALLSSITKPSNPDYDIKEIEDEWGEKRKEKQQQKNSDHKRWNKDIIDATDGGTLFWLKPSFEDELGLPKDESKKIDQALEYFMNIKGEDIPDCFKEPVSKLISL